METILCFLKQLQAQNQITESFPHVALTTSHLCFKLKLLDAFNVSVINMCMYRNVVMLLTLMVVLTVVVMVIIMVLMLVVVLLV